MMWNDPSAPSDTELRRKGAGRRENADLPAANLTSNRAPTVKEGTLSDPDNSQLSPILHRD